MEISRSNVAGPNSLASFYTWLYRREKHDSPDKSRTDMVRRMISLLEMIINTSLGGIPRVLDIGAGRQALEGQFRSTVGKKSPLREVRFVTLDIADIAKRALIAAESEVVSHVRADAAYLPFRGESFDMVVSNHAIDFLNKIEVDVYSEAFRVLRKGGYALFNFHHPSLVEGIERVKSEEVRSFWTYLRENNVLFQDEDQIREKLKSVGFSVLEVTLVKDGPDQWWEVVAQKV